VDAQRDTQALIERIDPENPSSTVKRVSD
jgi:hypothetical protein